MRTGIRHQHIPGLTAVPDTVRRAMAVPLRTPVPTDLADLVPGLLADLRPIFGMRDGALMLVPGSATDCWEAAITRALSPGDTVLMARHGHFSTLWAAMAERLGLIVRTVDAPRGAGVPAAELARILGADRHGAIKAVFVTHTETSTGVTSDVAAVRRALDESFHDALLCVDGASSIGSVLFRMDAWGVDVAVASGQRGFMLPAGLAMIAVSPRVRAEGLSPRTPPIPLLHGLRRALDRIADEGLERVFARHRRLATGVRAAVAAWGMDLVAQHPGLAADTVTAVQVPEGVDAREVIRLAHDRYNCAFGSGLGPLAGRVFRIGHLGDLNEGMVLTAIALAELALVEAGAPLDFGTGVAAAQAAYTRAAPAHLCIAAE